MHLRRYKSAIQLHIYTFVLDIFAERAKCLYVAIKMLFKTLAGLFVDKKTCENR